jgi:uncharacterized protein (TIGR02246 family)
MGRALLWAAAVAVVVGFFLAARNDGQETKEKPQADKPQADKQQAEAQRHHDEIVASAKAFEDAYNAHDAQGVAATFTENAEMIDEDGVVTRGRAELEKQFTELFTQFPKAVIKIEVEAVRIVETDLAIEEGVTIATPQPADQPVRSQYTAIHVRRNGKWLVASVRDYAVPPSITPNERLQPLAWLVGDWIDESPDSLVETSCRWSEDGNYLLQDFKVKIGGGPAMSGTQRIGWDPLRQQVRSWVFDSHGGYIEAFWSQVGDSWMAKATGVGADGTVGSATRIVTPIDNDSFLLESRDRILGDEALPHAAVLVVRRPPAPGDK